MRVVNPQHRPRAILLGLDGATFRFIDPFLAEGHLPAFSHFKKHGLWGDLRSTVPPYTPQAWASISTGVNPGRHGVFGFFYHNPVSDKYEYFNSRSVKAPKIWNILDKLGYRSLVVNVPMTYPPERLNGTMITGMMTPGRDVIFTFPPALNAWFWERFPEYVIDIAVDNRDQKLGVLDELERMALQREEVMYTLMERNKPDFVYVVFVILDRIHHLFGKYLDPAYADHFTDGEVYHRLLRIYQTVDGMLGRVLDWAVGQTDVVVVSDHGFGGERGIFYTNEFLRRAGFLHLAGDVGKRSLRHATGMGGLQFLKNILPRKWVGRLKRYTGSAVDYEKSLAYAAPIPQQGIVVNPRLVESETERERLITDIMEQLADVRCPDDDETRVTRIHRREELYHGPFLHRIPDILFAVRDFEYDASNNLVGRKLFDDRSGNPRGKHMLNGIFMAVGPRVNGAGPCGELGLEQVAPSLMKTFGYTSDHFDGDPLPSFVGGVSGEGP
jgi:predicted AlkP superfamily phosphohydrolase/phosphomutase